MSHALVAFFTLITRRPVDRKNVESEERNALTMKLKASFLRETNQRITNPLVDSKTVFIQTLKRITKFESVFKVMEDLKDRVIGDEFAGKSHTMS